VKGIIYSTNYINIPCFTDIDELIKIYFFTFTFLLSQDYDIFRDGFLMTDFAFFIFELFFSAISNFFAYFSPILTVSLKKIRKVSFLVKNEKKKFFSKI